MALTIEQKQSMALMRRVFKEEIVPLQNEVKDLKRQLEKVRKIKQTVIYRSDDEYCL